jgi:hypothetical protein
MRSLLFKNRSNASCNFQTFDPENAFILLVYFHEAMQHSNLNLCLKSLPRLRRLLLSHFHYPYRDEPGAHTCKPYPTEDR